MPASRPAPTRRPRTAVLAVLLLAAGLLPGAVLLPGAALPAAAQVAVDRIDADDPVDLAVAVSQRRFEAGAAGTAALATTADFADAMAASPLAASGPLLLTGPAGLDSRSAAELQRAVPTGSAVRLVGGEAALAPAVADDVAALGYRVERLEGPTRLETAVAVADAVGSPTGILLVRAFAPAGNPTAAWADAIAAAVPAAAQPGSVVVLTESDRLSTSTAAYLRQHPGTPLTLIGGTAALGDEVAEQAGREGAGDPRRVAGSTRDGTAAAIARDLLGVAQGASPRTAVAFDGYAEDGWAYGLAAAGLAADLGAPLVPVNRTALAEESARLIGCGTPPADRVIAAGGTAVLPDATVQAHLGCPPPPAPPTAPLQLLATGLAPDLPFGMDPDQAVAAISARLGQPTEDSGWIEGCPVDAAGDPNERYVDWGELTAFFYDPAGDGGSWRSWTYGRTDGLGLRTDRGAGPATSNADFQALYPQATLEDELLGPLWRVPASDGGPLLAVPADTAPGTPIDLLIGGQPLFCE